MAPDQLFPSRTARRDLEMEVGAPCGREECARAGQASERIDSQLRDERGWT